jgi:type II secretory pathway component GspD/PulD (secretin)
MPWNLPDAAQSRRYRCAARLIQTALLAVSVLALGGCAQKGATPAVTAREVGDFTAPVVVSSQPAQDGAAYAAADEKLSQTDWQQLEKLGPRPIWDQIEARQHECAKLHVSSVAATQPAKISLPAPTTMPAPLETDLPVQRVDLPGNRVRLVWTLRNYGGPTVKSSRDATTARRSVELAPPDLAPLVAVVMQTIGKEGAVTPLPRENSLVVTCDKTMRAPVEVLLDELDHAPRQVEIAAKIFEVSHDFDFQQGTELVLNRLASDGGQNLVSTFSAKRFLDAMKQLKPAPVQGSVLNLMQVFQAAGISVDVSFQFLSDAGLIQVVSQPRITVAVGQTGYMLAGQEVPIQSSTVVNNALTLGTAYKPVGVQLYVTPEAAGPLQVKLHTISIVSAVSGFSPVGSMDGGTVAPLLNPVIESREAETAVNVRGGNTLVISGLRMIRTITREEKVPGLGDIPLLGWLFKNHRTQQQQTDLYFFITPTIL